MADESDHTASGASFELEVVSQLSEADYALWQTRSMRPRRPGRARAFKVALTVVSLACFASWYTVVLGLVLGAVAVAAWTSPRWFAWSARDTYRKAEYLHGPLIYGVSSRGLWFRGGALRAECTWDGLRVWGEQDGFFWLAPAGMPQVILPTDTLRAAGIYERVRGLAAAHGVDYDSAAALAGRRPELRAPATFR